VLPTDLHREIVPHRVKLWANAEDAEDRIEIVLEIVTAQVCTARGGRQQAGQNRQRRRLASAVGTKQTEARQQHSSNTNRNNIHNNIE
jgi:hypothetical protein